MNPPDETPKKNLGWLPPEVEARIPEISARQEEAEERISSMFAHPARRDAPRLLTGRKITITLQYLDTSDIREALGTLSSMVTYLPVRLTRHIPLTGVAVVDAELLAAEPVKGTITVALNDMQAALLGLSSAEDRASFNAKAMNISVSRSDNYSPQGRMKVNLPQNSETNPDLSADQTAMLTGRFENAQETSDSHDALHDEAQSQGRTDARAGMDAELQQMRDDAPETEWEDRVVPEASALAERSEKPVTPLLDRIIGQSKPVRLSFIRYMELIEELETLPMLLRNHLKVEATHVPSPFHSKGEFDVTATIKSTRSLWEDLK